MKQSKLTIGALLWVASLQYYVLQLVVAAGWSQQQGYSWAANTISDLANTHCGQYGTRLVCSPYHSVMNLSFIVLGLTMIGAAALLSRQSAINIQAKIGFGCLLLAGLGTIVVGLFPENTVAFMHVLGAALPFILGNVAILLLGLSMAGLPRALRVFSVTLGLAGLSALVLFMMQAYMGLGLGGMERVVAYPQSIWMIVTGTYLLVSGHSKARV